MSFTKAAALGERILEDREARGTELRGKTAEIAYITAPNGSTLPETVTPPSRSECKDQGHRVRGWHPVDRAAP
jgi:hypothetical protein